MMSQNDTATLYNTKWILEKIHLSDSIKTISAKKAYIQFKAENKSVGGNGSCNRFGGTFTLMNDSLTIGQLFSTKMFCAEVQETENLFLSSLQKVNRFELKEDRLILFQDDSPLLEFYKE